MYPGAKVYHDGSHYVAIPHTEIPSKKRAILHEEEAVIYEDEEPSTEDKSADGSCVDSNENESENEVNDTETTDKVPIDDEKPPKEKHTGETKSQVFNRLYDETKDMTKAQRKAYIMKEMRKYFRSREEEKRFVEQKLERKRLNMINRRMRFARKANLNAFNYFVTFTRNNELFEDEMEFKRSLSHCLQNYHTRQNWLYMGVWERAKTGRLHFHVFLKIPDGTMPGELVQVDDFDNRSNRMQHTTQNTFFNKRFGRTDFAVIPDTVRGKQMAMKYMTKYLEKSGEKIVYSRGIPMYVISDIEEQDVMATMQNEYGEKLVLHDKFNCWDDGCYVGEMSEETKEQLRTANH